MYLKNLTSLVFFICTSMVTMVTKIVKPMIIWHYLLENILSTKTTFLNYTNVNSCFVNYYSHSIKEVDLLYQHLDVFTVDISINGLKPGFLNLSYFELSEVGIIY